MFRIPFFLTLTGLRSDRSHVHTLPVARQFFDLKPLRKAPMRVCAFDALQQYLRMVA